MKPWLWHLQACACGRQSGPKRFGWQTRRWQQRHRHAWSKPHGFAVSSTRKQRGQ